MVSPILFLIHYTGKWGKTLLILTHSWLKLVKPCRKFQRRCLYTWRRVPWLYFPKQNYCLLIARGCLCWFFPYQFPSFPNLKCLHPRELIFLSIIDECFLDIPTVMIWIIKTFIDTFKLWYQWVIKHITKKQIRK
jgi:hypothetical protein